MKTRKIVAPFIALLAVAHTMQAQTILTETFGTTVVAAASNYRVGTATPSVNYTTNVAGYNAVAAEANNISTYAQTICFKN